MKTIFATLLLASLVFAISGCEMEDDGPDDEVTSGAEINQQGVDPAPLEDCASPNMVFDDRCCSPLGTLGGPCKYDREWLSEGGCYDEYYQDGVQYCCGGKYLSERGAYGFQCVEAL